MSLERVRRYVAALLIKIFTECVVMFKTRGAAIMLVLSLSAVGFNAPDVMAQASDSGTSAPTKAAAKAQRRADRKAARVKKNTELNDLEKHGYQPSGAPLNYPQNIQNAEKNAAAAKPNSALSQ